jgi:hypothetical protein
MNTTKDSVTMTTSHYRIGCILLISVILLLSGTPGHADESVTVPATAPDERLSTLQKENEALSARIGQLESISCIPAEKLHLKKALRLKEIAADVKIQRKSMSDFEGFVKWMSANLACYNRYIQAGSYAAVLGRMLPIPYAGQAAIFTKFVAQFTVALNAASVSINNYLTTSQKFIKMTDPIEPSKSPDARAVAEAAGFADQHLLKDMNDTRAKLAAVSDLSSGALSFLESLNHYVSGTDEYWNKAKGLFKKDIDPKEKSFISESTSGLKSQADRFNARLKNFEELSRKEYASVKSLAVYDELAADLTKLK